MKDKRTLKLVIGGILPDLNIELNNAKRSAHIYAKAKKQITLRVQLEAMYQLPKKKVVGQSSIICRWFMKDRRKDPDNVAFAIKYILDGLQAAGVLQNDGFDQVGGGIAHLFEIDKKSPRVEITILENRKLSFDV